MGQQQLLLLVLGIVIVGLAVVVGIQAYSDNQKKANADAMVLTAVEITTKLQLWMRTPSALGGGMEETGAITPVENMNVALSDLGFTVNGAGEYETIDGIFSMMRDGDGIFIEGNSATTSGGGDNNLICVEVNSHQPNDYDLDIRNGPGTCG